VERIGLHWSCSQKKSLSFPRRFSDRVFGRSPGSPIVRASSHPFRYGIVTSVLERFRNLPDTGLQLRGSFRLISDDKARITEFPFHGAMRHTKLLLEKNKQTVAVNIENFSPPVKRKFLVSDRGAVSSRIGGTIVYPLSMVDDNPLCSSLKPCPLAHTISPLLQILHHVHR
jgi:hypothetical protein